MDPSFLQHNLTYVYMRIVVASILHFVQNHIVYIPKCCFSLFQHIQIGMYKLEYHLLNIVLKVRFQELQIGLQEGLHNIFHLQRNQQFKCYLRNRNKNSNCKLQLLKVIKISIVTIQFIRSNLLFGCLFSFCVGKRFGE